MSSDVIGVRAEITTNRSERGTVCCCETPDCAGTVACYREFAASETGWRTIADRPARWVLANGQAV
jgi:hypothetical protein